MVELISPYCNKEIQGTPVTFKGKDNEWHPGSLSHHHVSPHSACGVFLVKWGSTCHIFPNRLVGPVVKASAPKAAGPGFDYGDFFFRGRVIPMT